jgi:hypothetical protein
MREVHFRAEIGMVAISLIALRPALIWICARFMLYPHRILTGPKTIPFGESIKDCGHDAAFFHADERVSICLNTPLLMKLPASV